MCAHKALDQADVAAKLKPTVGDNTTFVIIQNGVGNEEAFRNLYPKASIVTCVVSSSPHPPRASSIADTQQDLGRCHPDQPRCSQAHEVRGYANWHLPQPSIG